MTDKAFLAGLVSRTVAGDTSALDVLLNTDHEELRAATPERLLLERPALLKVLNAWRCGALGEAQVQAWASFLLNGYAPSRYGGPVYPIDIEYDPASEKQIVCVLNRLEQLGDAVDGQVSETECSEMIRSLEQG